MHSLLLVCFDSKSSLFHSQENAAVFVLCYRALERYSVGCPLPVPICKLLKDLVLRAERTGGKVVPENVREILEGNQERGDGRLKEDLGDFHADYCIDIDNVNKRVDGTRVDQLVTKWTNAAEEQEVGG